MSFFQPEPMPEPSPPLRGSSLPAWSGPPTLQMPAVVAMEKLVARSANVVITLPLIRVFRDGCELRLEVATRSHGYTGEQWLRVRRAAVPSAGFTAGGSDELPDRLLRMGVRYADGHKATTLRATLPSDKPPTDPILFWTPSDVGSSGTNDIAVVRFGLWLWPLPPPEPFELAVEWPLGGIELTWTRIDGSVIATAIERVKDYWP